jgi:hypothetical protein
MKDKKQLKFEESVYREIDYKQSDIKGNIIKGEKVNIAGSAKITVEEESADGVKVVLKKDENNVIKEIKFVCSCGQTKSIILDYSE